MKPARPAVSGSCRRRAATLGLLPALIVLGGVACSGTDDASRPGFPRTGREPIAGMPFAYAEPEDVGLSARDVWWLKERLYSRVVARRVIGAEILVVKDDRIVLHQAMGWADRDELVPLERNAIFPIASMTKPVIGTAALMLVDEGRLGLDDAVADRLPSFDNERSRAITVRQLLTHRSGFVQGGAPPGYRDQPTLRAAVDLAGRAGPDFPPGDRFVYSNLNSDVLGALVEEVSDEPVDAFIEARILEPLRLESTFTRFAPGASWAARVVSSYRNWGIGRWERYWHPARDAGGGWFSPAGDLFGSAVDYARFLDVWMKLGELDGARLLSDGIVREALADPEAVDGVAPRDRFVGMHWEIYAPPATPGGLPVFGHRGATGTVGLAIPERNAIVVLLTNSQETDVVEEVIGSVLEMFSVSP